jgi:hypothetical protein
MLMREPQEPFASNAVQCKSARIAHTGSRFVPVAMLLSGMLVLGATKPAHADDEATTAIARERFKEGVQFFDQKLYDKARAAFVQAYALKRHPAVLLNLAQSELRSGHEAEAAAHFAQFLRESKEATDAERQSAESGLSAAKAVITEVSVSSDEEGAIVSVDGSPAGQTPLPSPLYLAPGSHTLSAKKDTREAKIQVTAVAGQSTSTTLRLKKVAAAPPAEAEKPTPPRSEATKPAPAEPAAESSAASEGNAGVSTEGSSRRPFLEWATHSPFAIAGEGLTLAGLGVGIGGAFASRRSYNSANSVAGQIRVAGTADVMRGALLPGEDKGICANPAAQQKTGRTANYQAACNKYQDRADSGDTWKTVAIAGFVVAGAAAVGTIVGYLVDGKEPAASARAKPTRRLAGVVPWYTGSERGLFFVGEF